MMVTLCQWAHGFQFLNCDIVDTGANPCSTHLHINHHHHHHHHNHLPHPNPRHHRTPSVHLRGGGSSFPNEEQTLEPPPTLEHALMLLVEDPTHVFSVDNYILLLGECRRRKSFKHSHTLYLHICGNGLEADHKLGNHLVPTFVECGNICEAHQIFNKLLYHNEHSWTALLQGYAEKEEFENTLSIWGRMQLSGVHPSRHTFVPLLKVCSMMNYVDQGRKLHHEIIREGFESDLYLADTLVDMYGKFGFLMDAQRVFDKIVIRGVVTWTALIGGYTECGFGEIALFCLAQMQLEGISPNNITYMFALKSCISIGDMNKGQEIHSLVIEEGFESDPFISSALIGMYATFGSIIQAQDVFHEVQVRDLVVWSTIMAGYVEHGLYKEALACFKEMQSKNMVGNSFTFVCSLKACGNLGAVAFVEEMYHEIIKRGYEKDPFICSTLIAAYANCRSFEEAHCVFDRLTVKDSVSWAALVSLYTAYECHEQAVGCLEEIREDGLFPNAVAYKCILKSCGIGCAIDDGSQVHSDILKEGMERDPLVSIALIEMYSKFGNFIEARKLFNSFPGQTVASWAALISGYSEHGLNEEILLCLKEMLTENVPPDALIFSLCLKACASLCDIDKGREVHNYIVWDKMETDPYVGTALVEMYGNFQLITEVQEVFEMLQDPDVVAWTALIAVYAENGHLKEALGYLEQMQVKGVSPDDLTFICIMKCSSNLKKVHEGRYIHAGLVKKGLESYSLVGSSLVDLYGKSGCLLEAQQVFDKLIVKDMGVWSALLRCYVDCGFHKEVLHSYRLMEQDGISPQHTEFSQMLKACSTLESIEQGQEIHSRILMCGLETNDLLVENLLLMYAAFSMVVDAQGVFDKLLCRNLQTWNALIHVYVKYGNSEKAFKCMKEMQLQSIYPNHVTYTHVLRSCNWENRMGWEVHMDITKLGLERDIYIGQALVEMYSKSASLEDAQDTFDNLPLHDTMLWNVLIKGYAYQEMGVEAIQISEQMQVEGVWPDSGTFASCLKAYKTIRGSLPKIRDIHNEVVIFGFQSNLFMASNLMEIYLKYGLFEDAQRVFDGLGQWHLQTCSTLIMGYAEQGRWKEVLDQLDQMYMQGISLDAAILVYGLKASGRLKAIHRSRELHAEIVKTGVDVDPYIHTSLISMYSRCDSLAEASQLFSKELIPSVISWTALISGFVDCGFGEEALGCLDRMHSDGIPPEDITLIRSLEACSMIRDIDKGHQIHIQILQFGLEGTPTVGGALLDMYGNCGPLLEAESVFDLLPMQDVIIWTELMFAYVMNGFADKALQCFDRMQIDGISPDAVTFICVLKACVSVGGHTIRYALEKCRVFHIEILKFGFDVDTFIESGLIEVYSKCGAFPEANKVFDKMPISNIVSWTFLISGYVESGFAKEALGCVDLMRLDNVLPDEFNFSSILEACIMISDIDNGRKVHIEILKFGLDRSLIIRGSILNMYANCGSLVEAENVFLRMPEQDTVTWTELMFAYVRHMHGDKALRCFDQMQMDGISPDTITFNCSLKACVCIQMVEDAQQVDNCHHDAAFLNYTVQDQHSSNYDAIEKGQELHIEIVKLGFDMDTYIKNGLLDMYSKCGAFADAQKVFSKMPIPNIVSWTILISGYTYAGFVEEALGCMDEMKLGSVVSDEANFICTLEACIGIGALNKGREIHIELVKFGLEGSPIIGATLLHMYGKHGSLVEAESVFNKLAIKDVVTWTTLMFAYVQNELGDDALWCFEQMQIGGICPNAIAFFIGLKACVNTGSMDKAQEIHTLAVKQGMDMDLVFGDYIMNVH